MPGGSHGEFPLHFALSKGYSPTVIEKLLQKGQDPSIKIHWHADGSYGFKTCQNNSTERFRSPDFNDDDVGVMLPLHMAIRSPSHDIDVKNIIELLVESRCP